MSEKCYKGHKKCSREQKMFHMEQKVFARTKIVPYGTINVQENKKRSYISK